MFTIRKTEMQQVKRIRGNGELTKLERTARGKKHCSTFVSEGEDADLWVLGKYPFTRMSVSSACANLPANHAARKSQQRPRIGSPVRPSDPRTGL